MEPVTVASAIQIILGLVGFLGVSLVSYLVWHSKKYIRKVDDHDKDITLLKEITKNMVTPEQVRDIVKEINEPILSQLTVLNGNLNTVFLENAKRDGIEEGYEKAKKEMSTNGN